MARKNPERRSVTIAISEEEADFLDQAVFSWGLEGRAAAVRFYMTSGRSALATEAAVGELVRQTVNGVRKHVYSKVAEAMGQISKEYGEAAR